MSNNIQACGQSTAVTSWHADDAEEQDDGNHATGSRVGRCMVCPHGVAALDAAADAAAQARVDTGRLATDARVTAQCTVYSGRAQTVDTQEGYIHRGDTEADQYTHGGRNTGTAPGEV
jgi:hypothetical protein